MPRTLVACSLALMASAGYAQATQATDTAAQEWNFRVYLDNQAVGAHRVRVTGPAQAREVSSEAEVNLRLLGIVVYHYRHSAQERWRGACLAALDSRTDDERREREVHAEATEEGLLVTSAGAPPQTIPGCVMSFAYWNPELRAQTRLLNPQNGRLETVGLTREEEGRLEVQGHLVAAERWRMAGPGRPIDVWYALEGPWKGRWVGLDAQAAGGRVLRYRLPAGG